MSRNSSALLTVNNLSKQFITADIGDKKKTLEDISLSVNDGEIVSIVGPSGCGKSTLLNIIAGLEAGYEGEALFEDSPISNPHEDIGMVFQRPELFSWLDVRSNIGYGLKIRKMTRDHIKSIVDSYLMKIGMADFHHFHPDKISGGMQQRVALARALVMKPRLLLMDEPFSALDYQSRLEMQGIMLRLWDEYRPAILFVTHDIEESLLLSDRILVMSKLPGRIKKEFIVDFKRPRDISLIRTLKFNQMKADILEMLSMD